MGVYKTSMLDVMAPEAHQNIRRYACELCEPTFNSLCKNLDWWVVTWRISKKHKIWGQALAWGRVLTQDNTVLSTLLNSKHPLRKWTVFAARNQSPYNLRTAFSKQELSQPVSTKALFTAKSSNSHMHVTLCLIPPTSLIPPFLHTQNSHTSMQRISVLCAVHITKSALYMMN